MAKAIKIFPKAQLIDSPDEWKHHQGPIGKLVILESEKKAPGKHFFYFEYDSLNCSQNNFLKCSPGLMFINSKDKTLTFYTLSKHTYKFNLCKF